MSEVTKKERSMPTSVNEVTKKERSMPRPKGSEMGRHRQSTRMPLHPKTTSSSESNSIQSYRPIRDRSPKLDDHRRSPRSPLPEVGVCTQRKRGNRVADLETRLGHAKEEMRKLKKQLASAENAKKDAQMELEETKKLISTCQQQDEDQTVDEKIGGFGEGEIAEVEKKNFPKEEKDEIPNFHEIPIQVNSVDSKVVDFVDVVREEEHIKEAPSSLEVAEEVVGVAVADPNERNGLIESSEKAEEEIVNLGLEDEIARKDMEIESYIAENTALKKQIEEANTSASAAKLKEAELGLKVRSLTEELEHSRAKSDHLEEQLEAMEAAKTQLETEMKRLRVQTDQWRKAADAAAAIISGDGPVGFDRNSSAGCRMMSERRASSDKHLESQLMASEMEEMSTKGKRKGAGILMFGELLRKKGQQK